MNTSVVQREKAPMVHISAEDRVFQQIEQRKQEIKKRQAEYLEKRLREKRKRILEVHMDILKSLARELFGLWPENKNDELIIFDSFVARRCWMRPAAYTSISAALLCATIFSGFWWLSIPFGLSLIPTVLRFKNLDSDSDLLICRWWPPIKFFWTRKEFLAHHRRKLLEDANFQKSRGGE